MSDVDESVEPDEKPTIGRRALRWAREIAVTLVLGVAVVFGVSWLRAPDLPTAPDFTLMDLEGNPVSLADYRGRTVIVNFWATWCAPCRVEAPSFSAFAEAHPDVPVLGLVVDGPAPKVKAAARHIGITYTVLQADPATVEAWKVSSYPTTFVVNPDGSIRWVHTGIMLRPMIAWTTGRLW